METSCTHQVPASTMESLTASQIFDSRGNPTVRVVLRLKDRQGVAGQFEAQVPSGASKGSYEAHELRDGGKINIGEIRLNEQSKIDDFLCQLDGTEKKEKMGANALLAVSMVCTRAGAAIQGKELFEHLALLSGMPTDNFILPVPFMNQINGGVHSGNTLAFQEFMIAPVGAQTFTHAMQICTEIYHTLKSIIIERSGKAATGLGDEGGFAPPLKSADEALHLLELATLKAGYSVYRNQSGQQHGDVAFGIDPASSEFFDKKRKLYDLGFKFDPHDKAKSDFCLSSSELGEVYESICKKYSVILLEDPFAEDDFDSWKNFTREHSCGLEIVGDDLLATNPKRIRIGIEQALCNSLLLKINQIGTITEAIESAQLARNNGWRVFVSHRSGETVDDFIADLAVGLRTGHLKCGAPARGERLAKYNRLLAIESILQSRQEKIKYSYAGYNTQAAEKK
ncbi:hypothetical protein L7F22_044249 [Adiantum nelumboides]|nr:hypothetical protein [Adiantum nelumboides]